MHIGTKRLGGLVALTVAGLLGVAACGSSSNSGGAAQASAGYAACSTSPDTCNSGPRKDGGNIVVALGKYPSTWNDWSSDGNIVETVQQENLIVPGAYSFLPSGKVRGTRISWRPSRR
jgi:peptide/nickel transport system substrate-binding protein